MSILIRTQLVFVVSLVLPTNGSACSCYVRPLAERYESASVVLVAKIGERRGSYDASGVRVRGWSFDAVEVLKGDIGFGELTVGSCGGHLLEGGEYLIFTGNDGEVDSCRSGELNLDARYRADLEVLRERRRSGLEKLAEPWVFNKGDDGMCSLSLDMFNGGSLRFEYRFADSVTSSFDGQQYRYDLDEHRTVEVLGAGRHPASFAGFSRLSVWYPYSHYKVAGTGRLTIGGRDWTTQHKAMEAPYSPFEVVADSAFGEVLSAVEANEGVWLSAEYKDFPYNHKDYPDFPEIKAEMPHYYRGTAVQRFQECIDQAGQ